MKKLFFSKKAEGVEFEATVIHVKQIKTTSVSGCQQTKSQL